MKKKTSSIEDLKKEGLVKNASEIPLNEVFTKCKIIGGKLVEVDKLDASVNDEMSLLPKTENEYIKNIELVVPEGSFFAQEKPLSEFLKGRVWEFKTEIDPKAVTTADKITQKDFSPLEQFKPNSIWINQIIEYCAQEGIVPADLIETHRQASKSAVKGKKKPKSDNLPSDKPSKSEFMVNYKRKKLGL